MKKTASVGAMTASDMYLISQLTKFMISDCPRRVLDEFLKKNSSTTQEMEDIQNKLREAARWKGQNQSH